MQSRKLGQSGPIMCAYTTHEYEDRKSSKYRPVLPKKPMRLSLHRAASLQSVESAPLTSFNCYNTYVPSKKPKKRNYCGDIPHQRTHFVEMRMQPKELLQSPVRTPSRAESCPSSVKWNSSKPRPLFTQITMEK